MFRAFFKPRRELRFGARAFFDSESKDATVELGGRYRLPTLSLYWKVMNYSFVNSFDYSLCKTGMDSLV